MVPHKPEPHNKALTELWFCNGRAQLVPRPHVRIFGEPELIFFRVLRPNDPLTSTGAGARQCNL